MSPILKISDGPLLNYKTIIGGQSTNFHNFKDDPDKFKEIMDGPKF